MFQALRAVACLLAMVAIAEADSVEVATYGQYHCPPGPIRVNPQDVLSVVAYPPNNFLRLNPQDVLGHRCRYDLLAQLAINRAGAAPSRAPANPSSARRDTTLGVR